LKDRVAEVEAIIKKVGTCSLTTVGTDGSLVSSCDKMTPRPSRSNVFVFFSQHSRAMRPASTDKLQPVFIYDNSSHKDEEVKKDSHVNVSFLEPTKGDWISIAGKANTTTDRETVKKYFNPATKAWFGDLGDGVHDGTANDPRVTVLIVKPAEVSRIRFMSTVMSRMAKSLLYA
jgi:general stress protein 26